MVSFANIHIICLALMASNMIIGALSNANTGHHRHTHTPSPLHGNTHAGHIHHPNTPSSPHRNTHAGHFHHHNTPSSPNRNNSHSTYTPSPIKDGPTHDVTTYGAVGDGKTDDSKAFNLAWKAACGSESNGATMTVPEGKTFLVSPIDFEGPCKSSIITFEVQGNIVAPPRSKWSNKKADEWLKFHGVDGLRVDGNGQGLIDGQGATWWGRGGDSDRPTAVRFSHCINLHVTGLKHTNSQKNHVSITNCSYVALSNLHMTAPAKSPNTDGIDISHSTYLSIQDSVVATGDDCIAINGGTSNVIISNINCGPGHGISIGSLGKDGQFDQVESVHVTNCTFNGTENGVRIKTWQGGSGFARNITFSKITFIKADNPVLIDQYYCPHKTCANKKSAVEVSNVRYTGLHGTSICKNATITFRCSKNVPCTSIIMNDVNIKPMSSNALSSAQCINAHGSAHDCIRPSVNCLGN